MEKPGSELEKPEPVWSQLEKILSSEGFARNERLPTVRQFQFERRDGTSRHPQIVMCADWVGNSPRRPVHRHRLCAWAIDQEFQWAVAAATKISQQPRAVVSPAAALECDRERIDQ